MMFKAGGTSGDLNGFLDTGSHMKGELHFDDTFRVDGKLTGKIVSDGELIVGESGEVDGEIEVKSVYVSGRINGSIRASGKIEVSASGRVSADVQTASFLVEHGAFFEGRCSMSRSGNQGKGKVQPPPDRPST